MSPTYCAAALDRLGHTSGKGAAMADDPKKCLNAKSANVSTSVPFSPGDGPQAMSCYVPSTSHAA